MGPLVQVLGDVFPRWQPVVSHVLPGLVVIPPAWGPEGVLHLEKRRVSLFRTLCLGKAKNNIEY